MSTRFIETNRDNVVQSRFLTRVLRLDAVASGGLGVLLLAAGAVLEGPLGLPVAVSIGSGAFLVLWTVALLLVGRRPAIRRSAVVKVIAINLAWVVASLALILVQDLSGLGAAFVLVQAAVVGFFAVLQRRALGPRVESQPLDGSPNRG